MAHDDHSEILFSWNHLYEGFAISPADFYSAIEAAIVARGLVHISLERLQYRESGLPSRREYLRILRHDLAFEICGERCGGDFFVSFWFIHHTSMIRGWLRVFLLPMILPLLFMRLVAVLAVSFAEHAMGTTSHRAVALGFNLTFFREIYEHLFPPTHYATDIALIFQVVVQGAIFEVLGDLTSAQGLRALGAEEYQTLLGNFGNKKSALRAGRF